MIDFLIYSLFAILGILMVAGLMVFAMDSFDHLKWLNAQEKYWDNMKREREQKEKERYEER